MNPPPPKPDPALLEKIFPPRRVPRDQIGGCNPELGDYVRDFGDRTWLEVGDEAYCTHSDVYCLMDFETLIHFIAGFLRYYLSQNNYDDAWSLIYFAASDRFCDFCRMLPPEQRHFVIAYVDHSICNEFHSDENRERYQENRRNLLGASP